jgi:cytochrome bd-type quinol oxidase subunit 2
MHHLAQLINPVIKPIVGNIDAMTGGPAGTVSTFITNLITVFMSLGGLYFFVMLIMGGYAYITAGSDKEGVQKATEKIKNALIGIVILLSVYTIMWVVEALFAIPLKNLVIPTIP